MSEGGDAAPGLAEIKDLRITPLFQGPLARIHSYECLVAGPGLSDERCHPWHAIAMPHVGAFQLHVGGDSHVVEPNAVVYWNPTPYRSSHPFGCGDRGTGFVVPDEILLDAIAPFDPAAVDRPHRLFSQAVAPSPPRAVLLQRLLLLRLRRPDQMDELTIDETVLELVGRLATAPYRLRQRRRHSPPLRSRRQWVEALKAILVRRYRDRLHLVELGRSVSVSPYTLCRAFREVVGLSIHQYLNRLRLRSALERLATAHDSLSEIALDVGFSSHAHFTNAFQNEFGLCPRDFRRASLTGEAWRRAWTRVQPPRGC